MWDLTARRGALAGVLIVALTVAILADLMTPYGPVALTLGAAFLGLALVSGFLAFATPMKVMLEPRTCRVCGVSPNGRTCTKAAFS